MARIRSVHPSLFTDEAWVSCSPLARLFYIGLMTEADDQGLFEWKPLQLKMRLLPGDGADVPALLSELVSVNLISSLESAGKKLGAIRYFRRFQRPKKPTAQFTLPEEWRTYVGLTADGGEPEGGDDDPVPHRFPTSGEIAQQMEDGGSRKEESPQPPLGGEGIFEEAFAAFPQSGKASTTPAKARLAWQAACAEETPARLLKAAQDFAASDFAKHEKGRRVPSFHRWLTEKRYAAWIGGSEATPTWAGPPEIRAAIAQALGEPFARSYIDPAGWQDVPIRGLVPRNATSAGRIADQALGILETFEASILPVETGRAA